MNLLKYFLVLFLLSSCTGTILSGSRTLGVKRHDSRLENLGSDENIIIGRIDVIDTTKIFSETGNDTDFCRIFIKGKNSSKLQARYSDIITSTNTPKIGISNNHYDGYFLIRTQGKDILLHSVECRLEGKPKALRKYRKFKKENGSLKEQNILGHNIVKYEAILDKKINITKENHVYYIGDISLRMIPLEEEYKNRKYYTIESSISAKDNKDITYKKIKDFAPIISQLPLINAIPVN